MKEFFCCIFIINMQQHSLIKMTPLSNIKTKEWKIINMAATTAEKSNFEPSKRLGAVLSGKGQCILCG